MKLSAMNKSRVKLALLLSLGFAIVACSSRTDSGFAPAPDNDTVDNRPYEVIPLELDFTFDLSQQGIDSGELTGLATDPNTGERFILDREGQLFRFGLFGNFLDQSSVQTGISNTFGGLEWIAENQFYVAANDNSIYSFNPVTGNAELFASVPEEFGALEAVASDAVSNQIFTINSAGEKQLVTIDAEGQQSTIELDSRLMAYPISGLHAFDGSLYLASSGHSDSPEQAVVIELNYDGVFQRAWSLPERTPSALLVENREPLELAIATSDSASILFFESPVPGSEVIDEPLAFVGYEELDFDQPSGVDYAADRDSLIFITDFAEVHELINGEDAIERFELDQAQGSFEALAYGVGEIHLLMSDESMPESMVQSYALNGMLTNQTNIDAEIEANTVFEAMDFGQQTQTLYLLSTNEDEHKQLVRIADGAQSVTPLPDVYDNYVIVGVDISDDETQAIFVTDERIDDGTLLSGLAISIDLGTLEEQWRLAIAVPGEGDELIGLAAPSGIAVDAARSRLYVSSDVDESMLAIFELPVAQ